MKNNTVAAVAVAESLPHRMAALAALLILLGPAQASACTAHDPFTPDEFAEAPLVLVGDIANFEMIPGTNASIVTLRVTERLWGHAPDQVTLFWFGDPNAMGP
jgi:hypothetical protein